MTRRLCRQFRYSALLSITISLLTGALLTPLSAETLRVGGTQPPGSLGNPYGGIGPPSSMVWTAIYDGLVRFDDVGAIQPAIALAWENISPHQWRFHLRRNVKFHSGRELTAHDVVRNFEYLLSAEAQKYIVASRMNVVDKVEASDDYTVLFTTHEPDAILPKRLSFVMMVDPDAWVELGPDGFALKPVGTGPFRLTEWGAGNSRIILEAVNDSWRKSSSVDRVEIRTISDPAARLQALRSGQIDVAWGLGPDDLSVLSKSVYTSTVVSAPNIMSVALRNVGNDDSPLQNKAVRQALNYAVDKNSIAQHILGGVTQPAGQGAVAGTVGYNEAIQPYSYDPEQARRLLAEAGYADGFPLVLELTTNLLPADALIYQKMAEDIRAIGVDVELREIPWSNWIRKYTGGEWENAGGFSLTWNSAPMYDAVRPLEYFSCLKAAPFFCDRDIANRILTSNTVMDPVARENQLKSIMADVHDLAPAIWLVNSVYLVGMTNRIQHFAATDLGVSFDEVVMVDQ